MLGLGLLALYSPVAIYLKYSHTPQPDAPVIRSFMLAPFAKFDGDGHAYRASSEYIASLDELASSADDRARSPIVVYENEKPLGPAHSSHEHINQNSGDDFCIGEEAESFSRRATPPTRTQTAGGIPSFDRSEITSRRVADQVSISDVLKIDRDLWIVR